MERNRDELLPLQRVRAARRTVPVRRRQSRDAGSAARGNGVHPSRVPARCRSRPAVRLPRPRRVDAAAGRAQQPAEVAARSVRQGGHRRGRMGTARLSVSLRRRKPAEHERQRALHAEVGRREPVLRLGERPAAGHAVARDARVRAPRQGFHADASVGSAEPTRYLCGARSARRRRLVRRARCDRGRADARAPVRARPPPRADGSPQLLGLQLDRLLRAARRVQRDWRSGPAGAGVQADGAHVARRRDRSDPRRRVQPHRRRQSPRPDALVQGCRQRGVLPAVGGRQAFLRRLHGHRQHAQHAAPARAAAAHGQPAVLGPRDARRRIPVRPRGHVGAHTARRRPVVGVLRRHPTRPGHQPGQAHRRTVGCRRRRLPGRQLPAVVVGVERPVPRQRPRLLARPGAGPRRIRGAAHRIVRPLRSDRDAVPLHRSTS